MNYVAKMNVLVFGDLSMVAMGAAWLTGKPMPAANTAATPPAWPTAYVERQFLPQKHVKFERWKAWFGAVGN